MYLLLTSRCSCLNANIRSKSDRGVWYLKRWAGRYLKGARERLSAQLEGFDLSIEDVYSMQQTCAYEVCCISNQYCRGSDGANPTCRPLRSGTPSFASCLPRKNGKASTTREFSVLLPLGLGAKLTWDVICFCFFSLDISFWYGSAYGSPVAKVQGIGWVQELVSRLTKTPIKDHNSSTNSTLHNPVTFPLGNSLYVDATHEVVVLNSESFINLLDRINWDGFTDVDVSQSLLPST
jgi:hypothetical protein